MISNAHPATRRFSTIRDLIRTFATDTLPPDRDTVDVSFHSLLIMSLLCMWWGFVLLFCLEALR